MSILMCSQIHTLLTISLNLRTVSKYVTVHRLKENLIVPIIVLPFKPPFHPAAAAAAAVSWSFTLKKGGLIVKVSIMTAFAQPIQGEGKL